MADFPATKYVQRETENLPGIVYDPTKKQNLYSEDIQNLGGEIEAIENIMGTGWDPDGTDLKDYLIELESEISGKQASLGFTPENVANKDTTATLGTSDTKYPSQKAVKTYVDSSRLNGWTSVSDAWAYGSASTITVPSGATSIYSVGDKIKITQSSTVKYFFIIGVADTVLTVTGGTDYTVANSAISAISFSHFESPVGFPEYFNYTPTATAVTGSFTTASATGKFTIIGRMVQGNIDATITSVGTGAGLFVTVPVTSASSSGMVGWGREDAITGYMCIGKFYNTTQISVNTYTNGNVVSGGNGSIIRILFNYYI